MMIRSFSLSRISFYQFGFSDPHNRTSCLPRAQQGSEEELLVVVGGRAAGVYGAIRAKTLAPHLGVLVIEKGKPLSKKQNMLNSFPSRFGLVKRFWKYVLEREGLDGETIRASISKNSLISKQCSFEVTGKGQFKEEFVTAGGVPLSVISLKTMESKIQPRLFFAGEVLNIDEISGGFNFSVFNKSLPQLVDLFYLPKEAFIQKSLVKVATLIFMGCYFSQPFLTTPGQSSNFALLVPSPDKRRREQVYWKAHPIYLDKIFHPFGAIVLSVTFVLAFGEVIPQAICTKYGLAVGVIVVWLVHILSIVTYSMGSQIESTRQMKGRQ